MTESHGWGDPWGVNVVGYFRSELGTGEAARQVVNALDAARVRLLPVHGQTIPLNRQGHAYETGPLRDAPFATNVICINADALPEFVGQVGPSFFAGRYSVGVWFWEVASFPERSAQSFPLLEEVWAPTAHIARALEARATVPVTTVRIPVVPASTEICSRADLGLDPDGFTFLFSFDYLSVAERKNPLAIVGAFNSAFAPGDGVTLVLKCINAERDPEYHSALRAAAADRPDIRLIETYLSPVENVSLTAQCDCYVSLHRAEGFGLGMAEAMWHGRPVVATRYSGNLDFMTETNSLLVDHTLVPIGPGADPYPPDGLWADPDVQHAARLMRRVFDDREFGRRLGATAAADIRRTHSPQAAGEIMNRRLLEIRESGRYRAGERHHSVSPALAQLREAIARGPAPSARGGRSARGTVRNAVLRAMRPFTAYQQDVNAKVTAALDELDAASAEARRASALELARTLAERRGGD